jgi:hypothetical protein
VHYHPYSYCVIPRMAPEHADTVCTTVELLGFWLTAPLLYQTHGNLLLRPVVCLHGLTLLEKSEVRSGWTCRT